MGKALLDPRLAVGVGLAVLAGEANQDPLLAAVQRRVDAEAEHSALAGVRVSAVSP